jgi:predicted transcriptional regulator
MKLSVELTPEQERQLAAIAARLQITPEALAAAALRDLLERREQDFEAAAARVLDENHELYKRLA